MLQQFVDNALAVTKESVKTFTYESLNNVTRLINGVSALLLAILPGKTTILEGMHGWELRPTFRGPRLPRWMENGVSSFNEFIHELSVDSDTSSVDYTSGEDDDGDDGSMFPASPSSHTSRMSHSSSFTRSTKRLTCFRSVVFLISLTLWPLKFLLRIPFLICHSAGFRRGCETTSGNKRSSSLKDHVVQSTTDRRRGVIEDLHLAIEVLIEAIFDIFHKVAHFLLSPSKIYHIFVGRSSSYGNLYTDNPDGESVVPVPTSVLGDVDPTPTESQTSFRRSLNTDARTCKDVITELGYPYEVIRVVTSDGYVLLLERIPRRDSQKVVYLQHGILDSSMGWISNGIVGSPAFAAYDQGYDVFLGNLRGLVSREHIDKNISSRVYWKYSINEHGTKDIPALTDKIHEIKTSELKLSPHLHSEDMTSDRQPYKLAVVSHSLGGAVMLMYVIMRRIEEKPHWISRMILLSPAGFHEDSTFALTVVEHLILLIGPILTPIIPGLYIPTRFFRMLMNKLARDFHNYPAVGGLVQTFMSYVVGGDSSNWVGVLGLPHYNMDNMPGVSLRVAVHLAQIKRTKKFIMYDYGSAAANMQAYGSPKPLDLGQYYHLIDLPIDLVAGRRDRVIRAAMVRKHYRLMKRAGVKVSYNEFAYAHLDFTFSHREELLAFVMSRLLLPLPGVPPKSILDEGFVRVGRRNRSESSSEYDDDEYRIQDEIKPVG